MGRRAQVTETVRTVVSYSRSFPGLFQGVPECVYASVETYPAHEKTWLADCHVSLPNERREQWNTVRRFATREEASAYAAAFVQEAERIVAAVQAGTYTRMPHRVMRDECLAEFRRSAECDAAAATGSRQKMDSALLAFEAAWYRAHDFRDYLRPAAAKEAA